MQTLAFADKAEELHYWLAQPNGETKSVRLSSLFADATTRESLDAETKRQVIAVTTKLYDEETWSPEDDEGDEEKCLAREQLRAMRASGDGNLDDEKSVKGGSDDGDERDDKIEVPVEEDVENYYPDFDWEQVMVTVKPIKKLESPIAAITLVPADAKAAGHIIKMPKEILLEFANLLCALDNKIILLCFGLTCKDAYHAIKAVHKEPLNLDNIRMGTPDHRADCTGYKREAGETCTCFVPKRLESILLEPGTFKHIDFDNYKLCHNRGDGIAIFLNKAVYGEKTPASVYEALDFRYGMFFHFKKYNQYIMKGGTCRIESVENVSGPCVLPSPTSKSHSEWCVEVFEAIKTDIKWWFGKEDWLAFWKTSLEKCNAKIEDEALKMLDEFGDKHVWPIVSQCQRKLAERFTARYCEINRIGRN